MKSRQYTTGEKIANIFTHFLGALISIYGIVILVLHSKNLIQVISVTIFGLTLFLLFVSSVCYHSVTNEKLKNIFQKIDHSAIYLLIAGTYTPALILTLRFPLSIIMLSIIWGLSITGIIFYCKMFRHKYISTGLYLCLGWISLFFIYNVWIVSHLVVWLMLAGGILYTVGCAFYLAKIRYMHFVWHLFVIAGAAMQYFAIIELLKAVN
ncbi:MAG: hemolysin III family protein [Candidatus Gastranaerophilales bacterium]|nr:hemolysin III family protein [Candidatus Gastranaerophilales bacterium]